MTRIAGRRSDSCWPHSLLLDLLLPMSTLLLPMRTLWRGNIIVGSGIVLNNVLLNDWPFEYVAQPCGRRPAPPKLRFAIARLTRPAALARTEPPILRLRGEPADTTARPDQLEWQELPPGIVTLVDCARNNVAGHRRGIESVAAKTARQPNLRHKLSDLRHAVQSIAENAGPNMFNFHRPKLWKNTFDAVFQFSREFFWTAFPGCQSARP